MNYGLFKGDEDDIESWVWGTNQTIILQNRGIRANLGSACHQESLVSEFPGAESLGLWLGVVHLSWKST